MTTMTVTFLILLMLSGPIALFLTIRYGATLATSVALQKQVIRFWFTFAASMCGLLVFLAGVSSPVETLIGVIGSIALFQFILHRINLKVTDSGGGEPGSQGVPESSPMDVPKRR
jgi:hypothetical protein